MSRYANIAMAHNVYQVAMEEGVKRVVVASSNHAADFYEPLIHSGRESHDPNCLRLAVGSVFVVDSLTRSSLCGQSTTTFGLIRTNAARGPWLTTCTVGARRPMSTWGSCTLWVRECHGG